MRLALFDFDGTITSKDSLPDFIQFAVGKPRYFIGLIVLAPMLLKYKLNLLPNDLAKSRLIAYFFKNWSIRQFQTIADQYSNTRIDRIIRPDAMAKINWHRDQGHQLVLVSASIECWLRSWCQSQKITLIATQLEIKNGKITGNFRSKNCYGIEKANRIKQQFNLADFEFVYAYGDSAGDREMLALADEPHYKLFNSA